LSEASSPKNHQHIFGAHDFDDFLNVSSVQLIKSNIALTMMILHIFGADDFEAISHANTSNGFAMMI